VSKWLHWTADGKLLESHEGRESDTPRVGQRASPTLSNHPQLTRPPQFVR
jgi:hypothetical protein